MTKKIKITLIKSIIGRKPKHIQIAKQLGLRKLNKTVTQPDNPAVRGLVKCVAYLLKVEDCA
ncbi:MAG: 50S ribosomal protein L30 [Legionellales bacterium RIFCSPHIGHO2_12_FULL_42_9]|nr:MAG: 50S ribosomal protein L30 [Legionellales bacterium RIFCSPHIGHO2_12_FULL_42_9]